MTDNIATNLPTGKVWITSTFGNTIGHRKLSVYERRNPAVFFLSHRMHDTWDQAHAGIVNARVSDVKKLEHKLKLAKASLVRAQAMTQKERA